MLWFFLKPNWESQRILQLTRNFFFSFSKSFFIHSFILVHSFTKYVLDHIQNIGNDRNVQSVPEGKKNRNRNSGPLLLPPTMETWNIQSSIWSENNLFFFTENLIWSSAAVTKNHTLKAHVSHCLLYKKKLFDGHAPCTNTSISLWPRDQVKRDSHCMDCRQAIIVYTCSKHNIILLMTLLNLI